MPTMLLAFLALAAFAPQTPEPSDQRQLLGTHDETAMGRCLDGMVGFSDVQMRCVINAEGQATNCEILNPTPRIMRREYVFQCMASKMHFTFSDGSSTEGQTVTFGLGGRTVLSEEELRRERAAGQPSHP